MREEKQTFLEMLIGIIGSTLLFSIIGAVIAPNRGTFVLGTFLGGIIAIVILMQLYRSIERALVMETRAAEKYAVRAAMIRLGLMCIPLVISILLPSIFNVLGVFFGLLGLKFSAYTQPFVHKVIAPKI